MLEQMAGMARQIGKSEADIKAAHDECVRTDSDAPFRKLIMPDLMKQLGVPNG
jgi:hypothetical protein